MVEALQILFNIYGEFMKFVFNDMNIYTNVTFGWFAVAVFVFGVLIRNLLMLPKSAPNLRSKPSKVSNTNKGGD